MRTIAVIPALNEATRIGETVARVLGYVDAAVVVDDGSMDATAEAARLAGAVVVRHPINCGQGAGLRTGTEAALRLGAEVVVHLDADGQHDPSFIPALVAPIVAGEADIVFGSRFLGVQSTGMSFGRKILLKAARLFNAFVMGIPRSVTDPQSGLRAMTAAAARSVQFKQDRMAHCSEILRLVTHSTLRWKEIPVRISYTKESLAKGQKPTDALKIVWQLLMGAFQ